VSVRGGRRSNNSETGLLSSKGENAVASLPMRDQTKDHLLTPRNAALLVIDYQPVQVNTVNSMDRQQLVNNIVAVAKLGIAFRLPIVFTSVNVKTGLNKPPIFQLRRLLGDLPLYDRTAINAWEDAEFYQAVKETGRNKLIVTALWTEVCLTHPALDALQEGYEVYPVVDAVGGTTIEAHNAGLRRIEQAGAKPISWAMLACELQRDWNRKETVPAFMDTFIQAGGTAGLEFANHLEEGALAAK
jgi:nicotinamidase-related amidase